MWHNNGIRESAECGLWMATSTIPNAGLGLYAGRAYSKEEPLQYGPIGDLAIPLIDIKFHKEMKQLLEDPNHFSLWESYCWDFPKDYREGWNDCEIASPGFGSLPNSYPPLANIDIKNPIPFDVGLHRSQDPGAGAVTYFHGRYSVADPQRPEGILLPGEELFLDYGDYWFESRDHMRSAPLKNTFHQADDLVQMFKRYLLGIPENKQTETTTLVADSAFVNLSLQDKWESFLIQNYHYNARVLAAFHPFNETQLTLLLDGTTSMKQLKMEQTVRSLEWLQHHGSCADNIYASYSTIKQAGMGAVASRFLPKDSVVVSMPLIHILDRTDLEIYHFEHDNYEAWFQPDQGVRSHQLLLNYCMGHRESSLLLYSYAPVASYINHNQTLANAKLQWTNIHKNHHHPDLFERDMSELGRASKLVMDVVALRDIEPGEEIFLDYGDEWEQAWHDHTNSWHPVESADTTYVPARELNEKQHRLNTFIENIHQRQFSTNAELFCYEYYLSNDWANDYAVGWDSVDPRRGASQRRRCEITRRRHTTTTTVASECNNFDGEEEECEEQQQEEVFHYDAILWDKIDNERVNMIGEITNVPREAFIFMDSPYTTDINLPNAFRHDIRIPDDMFPQAWRNYRAE